MALQHCDTMSLRNYDTRSSRSTSGYQWVTVGTSGYQWVPVGTRSTKKTKSAVLPTSLMSFLYIYDNANESGAIADDNDGGDIWRPGSRDGGGSPHNWLLASLTEASCLKTPQIITGEKNNHGPWATVNISSVVPHEKDTVWTDHLNTSEKNTGLYGFFFKWQRKMSILHACVSLIQFFSWKWCQCQNMTKNNKYQDCHQAHLHQHKADHLRSCKTSIEKSIQELLNKILIASK